MKDKNDIISHLQIIRTWASFAHDHDMFFYSQEHLKSMREWSDEAIDFIEAQNNGWRLCSDELPPNDKEVLVTYIINGNFKKRHVEEASYIRDSEGNGHWTSIWDEYRVSWAKQEIIAWMPMPIAYKGNK